MELLLNPHELRNLGDDLRSVSIHCQRGCCWLTQAGDSRDHILRSGQTFTVSRRGKVLVMAAAASRLQLLGEPKHARIASLWRQSCGIR